MGVARDCFVGHATNPGVTVTAVSLPTGDTNVVRNFNPPAEAWIDQIVRTGATSGVARVRSPLMYDNVQGIRAAFAESPAAFLFGPDIHERVYPQDTLTTEVSGGGAETDSVAVSIYYQDLPGANARLHMWSDIMPLIEHIVAVEVSVTNSATIGNWTDTAINATFDNLKANRDHAILGVVTDTAQAAIAIKGPDTSNLRVLAPPHKVSFESAEAFVRLSEQQNLPYVPVFNSANKASTFISTNDVVASSTPNISVVLALLSQNLST